MDDTHSENKYGAGSPRPDSEEHPADAIANLDPADAPAAAEAYADDLAAELDEAGAASGDPVQLQADLGDGPAVPPGTDSE